MKKNVSNELLQSIRKFLAAIILVLYGSFFCMTVMAQNVSVTGSVKNTSGEPIPGVTILAKGTTNGTITDFNGNYSLGNVPYNGDLVFSFVGMKTQEMKVAGKTKINVVMEEQTIGLDEVVAVGYGTMKKSDLTGSIASISSDKLTLQSIRNPLQALTGLASGVQTLQNSGEPGGALSVRIRGGNSLMGSNEPLYVIDGFPVTGALNNLNPNDIQSMEILKDASATAIYGSRGANGIVLITTKKGKEGKTVVDYDGYVGLQSAARKIDLLNATEFATLANIRAANDKEQPYFTQDQISAFGNGTNWQNKVLRSAPIQNHTLSVSGGNNKTKFNISGNYFNEEGIIINSFYDRYQLRTNLQHKINSKLTVSLNLILSRSIKNSLTSDNTTRGNGVLSGALAAPPTLTVKNSTGEYSDVSSYAFSPDVAENPVAVAKERKNRITSNSVLTNMSLEYQIFDGLIFKSTLGIDYGSSRTDFYSSTVLKMSKTGSASIASGESSNFVNENILTYNKTFNKDHNLILMGGLTNESNIGQGITASSNGFLTNILENYSLQSGSSPGIPNSYYTKYSILSGLGRINYSYKGKYLVTSSIRADGSSRFGKSNKWGYFPSASLAWRVSEEKFLKNIDFISNLKLHGSLGKTGSTAISPYQSLALLSSAQTVFDNDLYIGFAPGGTKPNPDLKWESTTQKDLGFDFGILNNRFILAVDYYHKKTVDLLANVPLPLSSGYTTTLKNLGSIQNKGFEVSLTSNIIDRKLKWDININVSANRSKVLSLANEADVFGVTLSSPLEVPVNIVRVGQPVGVFYGYLEEGLTSDGLIKYKDQDGNSIINTLDRTIIGNPNPDFVFGVNSSLAYKNFNLEIFISGVQGNDIFNYNKSNVSDGFSFGINQTKDVLGNYWTIENPNPNAKYPKVSKNTRYLASNRYVEDGSYIRLKNIQLSYTYDKNTRFSWAKGSQIYISVQNLFTLTKYSWYSPDVNTRGGSNSISTGIDMFGFPDARTITLGLKLKL